jgi:hypothetical protein
MLLDRAELLQRIPDEIKDQLFNWEGPLDLSGLSIEEISEDCFSDLRNLKELRLNENLLKFLPERVFEHLENLEIL